MPQKVYVVGRPNVGKSTFFNIFSPKKAIVYDTPGVTRDVQEVPVTLSEGMAYERHIVLCDTPGLATTNDMKDPRFTFKDATCIVFIADGVEGLSALDSQIFSYLRKTSKPIIALINKSDKKSFDITPFYSLGVSHVLPISSAHQRGIGDFLEILNSYVVKSHEKPKAEIYKLAIMGRPNAGKSTLTNHILGEEKQLTGEMPGLTRDSIIYDVRYDEKHFKLIDTAGIRKSRKIHEDIEQMSVDAALNQMEDADGVIYLVDAINIDTFNGFDQQDLHMIDAVLQKGKCLVIGLNKWDQIKEQKKYLDEMQANLDFKGFHYVPIIPLSAVSSYGIKRALNKMFEVLGNWNLKITTGKLNRWLYKTTEARPPQSYNGRHVKLKYMTQIGLKPPKFMVFANFEPPNLGHYKRYMIKSMQKEFGLSGFLIQLYFKSQIDRNRKED